LVFEHDADAQARNPNTTGMSLARAIHRNGKANMRGKYITGPDKTSAERAMVKGIRRAVARLK
jgi:hypothetical protein